MLTTLNLFSEESIKMNGEAESGHKRPASEIPDDDSLTKRIAIDPVTTNSVNGGVVRAVLPGGGIIQQIRQVQPNTRAENIAGLYAHGSLWKGQK